MGDTSEDDSATDKDGSVGPTSGTQDVAVVSKLKALRLNKQEADGVHMGLKPVMLSGRSRHPSVGVALICVMK